MPVKVTENWSGYFMSFKPPWTAIREFDVSGVTNGPDALTAVDADTGLKIPKELDEHPESLFLLSLGPEIKERKGLDYFVIRVNYAVDDGKLGTMGGELLKSEPQYTWEHVEVSEAVDIDLDGLPILNSAGFALEGACRPIVYKKLHVVRYEPSWNIAKNELCENGVNDAAITLATGVTVKEEHMRCVSIVPEGTYQRGFRFLPIHYTFEIIFDDSLGSYPFQHRFLDQSIQGWYSDSGTKRIGRFTDGKGSTIDSPVLLDGTGLPLPTRYSSVKVGSPQTGAEFTAVTPPTAVTFYHTDSLAGGKSTILYFKKTKRANLSLLGL